MGYGGTLNNSDNRYSGKSSGNPTAKKEPLGMESGFMSYMDQDSVTMQLHIAKLEQAIEKENFELKSLEKDNELNQDKYNRIMNEILEAEKEKHEIVYEDSVLDRIYDKTKDLGIYTEYKDESGYSLMGDRNQRLGIIRDTDKVDQFEIDLKYKESRELSGEMEYNRKRISDLKKSLAKNKQNLEDAQDVLPSQGVQSEGWNY